MNELMTWQAGMKRAVEITELCRSSEQTKRDSYRRGGYKNQATMCGDRAQMCTEIVKIIQADMKERDDDDN